jgi:hypothetical protein
MGRGNRGKAAANTVTPRRLSENPDLVNIVEEAQAPQEEALPDLINLVEEAQREEASPSVDEEAQAETPDLVNLVEPQQIQAPNLEEPAIEADSPAPSQAQPAPVIDEKTALDQLDPESIVNQYEQGKSHYQPSQEELNRERLALQAPLSARHPGKVKAAYAAGAVGAAVTGMWIPALVMGLGWKMFSGRVNNAVERDNLVQNYQQRMSALQQEMTHEEASALLQLARQGDTSAMMKLIASRDTTAQQPIVEAAIAIAETRQQHQQLAQMAKTSIEGQDKERAIMEQSVNDLRNALIEERAHSEKLAERLTEIESKKAAKAPAAG